ncbi:hypothetical protein [Paenibacillus abyssi]|nr:hypothetical protein [Paenibacillus abyssi]
MNGKTFLSVVLIAVGGLIALKFIGLTLGAIIGFLFPFILMGLGVVGIKNDKKLIGGILFGIGLVVLLGKLSGLIFFLLAVGMVIWGISMLRRDKRVY